MPSSRVLLCLEISDPTTVWNRTLLTSYIPSEEDLLFYYGRLLGIKDVKVSMKTESIPEEFNMALLSVVDRVPTHFPVYDLETAIGDDERRTKYYDFIRQLCEMERSRAALRVFVKPASGASGAITSNGEERQDTHHIVQSRAWVNELLRSLNTDYDFEGTVETQDAIVASQADDYVPAGWIFTPSSADVRASRGSRIVVCPAIGKKWERLLGTDMFPDMVVSRRISTMNWAFQHAKSDALIKATLEWYLAAQDTTVTDGISGWILEADREMNALFATFRKIKVHERLIMEGLPRVTEKQGQAFKILSSVEGRLLSSAVEDPSISPISADLFRRYCTYLFRGYGLEKEMYFGNDTVNQVFDRWERSKFGFKHNVNPLLESWNEVWRLVMRGDKVTADRVLSFVRTLDCWDPVESANISSLQRGALGTEWIRIFVENELIVDEKARIRSPHLQARVKEYCLKYLPEAVFPTSFSPMIVGPILAKIGFTSTKTKDGRFTRGVRYKHPQPEIEPDTAVVKSTKIVNVVTETGDDSVSEKHTVTQSVTAENGSTRIEHFFSASVTKQEIHLGKL